MKVIAKPIDMIWYTDTEGDMTPIKFQIEEKNGGKGTYHILSVDHTHMTRIAGCKQKHFQCTIEVQGKSMQCEVRYELDTCCWTLFKIGVV